MAEFIAQRMGRIKPSPTVAVTAKANQLKAEGADVIPLAAGEPDFDTPEHIVKAANEALAQGKTRYAPPAGIPQLRRAIADKFKRENNLDYDPDEICVAVGGKQIIFNALMATIETGDEVIIPAPYWVSYPDITLLMGGEPVFIACSEDNQFKLTPQQLSDAITPKTKWLVLNSPCNPTGSAYTSEELKALGEVLLKSEYNHVRVLSDDIYEHVVYDGFRFSTLAEVVPELKSRTLTLNGFAKAYCMTGWRLGYAAGDRALIKAMTTLNSQSVTSATTFAQFAAVEALDGTQDFIKTHNQQFLKRRDFVVDQLNKMEGLSVIRPQGAFYVYPCCEGLIGKKTPDGKQLSNDTDVVTYLLEKEGLACVQGAAFGLEPYFRISYAVSMEVLEEAMMRLKRACDALE